MTSLALTRTQILAFRRSVGALDERLPYTAASLRHAAWAGLQDSMPRAALLSLHARVKGIRPTSWEHASLTQVWGPRWSAYVVPARDAAIFTRGRMPDDEKHRRKFEDLAERVAVHLAEGKASFGTLARPLGLPHPNYVRYATVTGRLRIRWEGARQPTLWVVPTPKVEYRVARIELARRYLHVFGPGTPASFGVWAGVRPASGPVGVRRARAIAHAGTHADRRRLDPARRRGADAQSAAARRARASAAERRHLLPLARTRSRAYSFPQRNTAPHCGRRACGPAACSFTARSPAPGDAPVRSSTSRRGADCREKSARRSRMRPLLCPCPN